MLKFVVQFSGIDAREATTLNGGVAQLGEHLPCKQGVKGSNPFISTSVPKERTFKKEQRERSSVYGLIAQVVRACA